ncbi:MAG: hypothetical protein H6773_01855 [Pseudomonadales bacterium]|nr:hypothetical protein [Pseudomonadales bacterium]
MQISHFAYFFFHLVVLTSLILGKMLYPKMKVPTKTEVFSFLPISLVFIVWDYLVTDVWWSFNPTFVLGFTHVPFLRLPIEELLFFVTVPYALVTFLKNLHDHIPDKQIVIPRKVSVALSLLYRTSLVVGLYFSFVQEKWYTVIVVLGLALTGTRLLNQTAVTIGLLFTLFTTLLFNYYLTSLPIVLYTDIYKTGALVGTIPIEDFGYAALLYLWIVKALYARKCSDFFET